MGHCDMAISHNIDTTFRFDTYSETALLACGDQFLRSCHAIWHKSGSEAWTEHVLDWFAQTAPDGVRVDARRARPTAHSARETQGEWIADMVHTSYPQSTRSGKDYWRNLMRENSAQSWTILLALESEWGKYRSPRQTFEMVFDDACKLTAMRADVKVLVTAVSAISCRSNPENAPDAGLQKALVTLRERTCDASPWLWVNLPNNATPDCCRYVMFGHRDRRVMRQMCDVIT